MNPSALITGASSGLGLCLTEKLLDLGYTVYGVSKTRVHWRQAQNRLFRSPRFYLFQFNVSSEAKVRLLISRILRKEGRLDVLINNAGYVNPLTPVEKETVREFEENFSTNLIGPFLTCKYAIPAMKKQKSGWIINVSSYAGKRAVPRLGAYSASKMAVLALTQSIAKENPDSGFKCITVCPGGMNTEMRARLFGEEEAARQQSPDFVAEQIVRILQGEIDVPSGGDIVIRHSQIAAIHAPEA